jgi:hypothetical protein
MSLSLYGVVPKAARSRRWQQRARIARFATGASRPRDDEAMNEQYSIRRRVSRAALSCSDHARHVDGGTTCTTPSGFGPF